MQVLPPAGQICNWCQLCHLMAKFVTDASCATWWPILLLMQVVPPGGPICKHCQRYNGLRPLSLKLELSLQLKLMQLKFSLKDRLSYRLNALGPLCLWHCFWRWHLHYMPKKGGRIIISIDIDDQTKFYSFQLFDVLHVQIFSYI